MFPARLDGAAVLMYTEKGDYGAAAYEAGERYDTLCYYAIARYDTDSSYYLFGCNTDFDVISDYLCDSIDDCKNIVTDHSHDVLWHRTELLENGTK